MEVHRKLLSSVAIQIHVFLPRNRFIFLPRNQFISNQVLESLKFKKLLRTTRNDLRDKSLLMMEVGGRYYWNSADIFVPISHICVLNPNEIFAARLHSIETQHTFSA